MVKPTLLLPYSPVNGDTSPEILALRAAYRRLEIVRGEGYDYHHPTWTAAYEAVGAGWRGLRDAVIPTTPCPIAAAAIAAKDAEACRALDLTKCTTQQVRQSANVAMGWTGHMGPISYCADEAIVVRGVVHAYDDSGPGRAYWAHEATILGVAVDDVAAFAWLFGLPVTHQRAAQLVEQGERAPGETRTLEDEALDGLLTAYEEGR